MYLSSFDNINKSRRLYIYCSTQINTFSKRPPLRAPSPFPYLSVSFTPLRSVTLHPNRRFCFPPFFLPIYTSQSLTSCEDSFSPVSTGSPQRCRASLLRLLLGTTGVKNRYTSNTEIYTKCHLHHHLRLVLSTPQVVNRRVVVFQTHLLKVPTMLCM